MPKPPRVKTSDFRKPIPMGVKLNACLLLLGFTEEEITTPGAIEFDHTPSLGLRSVDPETGEMIPAPNDPKHIVPLRKSDHRRKTNGPAACAAGGDIHAIAKAKRLQASHEELRRRLTTPGKVEKPKSKWPSRPFPKTRKESR